MKIFQTSYSTLKEWAAGNYDNALAMYFKTATYDNEAMALGRIAHDEWEKEIKQTGCMPRVFGGAKLSGKQKTEAFVVKKITDWLVIRGKIDLDDGEVMYDWKRGMTRSSQWAASKQHNVYQIFRPEKKRFEYHAYNPYVPLDQAVTVSVVHLTDKTLEDGIEWVITNASEMKNYIEVNDLEAEFALLPKVGRK